MSNVVKFPARDSASEQEEAAQQPVVQRSVRQVVTALYDRPMLVACKIREMFDPTATSAELTAAAEKVFSTADEIRTAFASTLAMAGPPVVLHVLAKVVFPDGNNFHVGLHFVVESAARVRYSDNNWVFSGPADGEPEVNVSVLFVGDEVASVTVTHDA